MVQCGALGGGLDAEGSPHVLIFFATLLSLEARATFLCLASSVAM